MRAMDLYAQLESDFITGDMTDTWAKYMGELEEKNLLGETHYSTEKLACQKMCSYFEKLGLPSGIFAILL